MTLALSVSASATRSFQSSTLRDVRPTTMTGCLAPLSSAAACLTSSGEAAGRCVRHEARHVDRRKLLGQLGFLQLGVEVDVDRTHRRGIRHPGRANDRLAGRCRRRGLVVPLGVVAHDRALVARGVNPVDPRPALGGVDRPGCAENHDRHAVAPGVEDRHGGVEQADVGVHRRRHRLAGHLGVAVRDRDRALLVQAEQHLRRVVAEIVDDRVMEAAIARAGIERDVGNLQRTQRFGGDVAAPSGRIVGRQIDRPVELAESTDGPWQASSRRPVPP